MCAHVFLGFEMNSKWIQSCDRKLALAMVVNQEIQPGLMGRQWEQRTQAEEPRSSRVTLVSNFAPVMATWGCGCWSSCTPLFGVYAWIITFFANFATAATTRAAPLLVRVLCSTSRRECSTLRALQHRCREFPRKSESVEN